MVLSVEYETLNPALEAQGRLAAPSAEEVTSLEAQEAWFKTLKSAHEFKAKPGACLDSISSLPSK